MVTVVVILACIGLACAATAGLIASAQAPAPQQNEPGARTA
ncbi:hypothetical protein ACFSX5_14785 [Devosia albogilva]|uniref:Uncharacterized protein n=1 Tax=Devosia albogilva TaxID=429726 RepID=A0ABW5QMS8_9HYPH